MSGGSRVADGLTRFWRGVIVDPIRHGRLRDTGWPVGLRPIMVVGVVAFCIAVVVILGAPVIRAVAPLSVTVGGNVLSLPRLMLPTIFWLVVLSLALMQTAALHTRRRTTVVLTVMTALILLFVGSLDLGVDGASGVTLTLGKVVSVIAVVSLVGFVLLRRRATFAWWEFVVVVAIIGGSMVVSLGRSAAQSAPYGIDFGPSSASLVMSTLGQLAVPAALAAGVAAAEFAVIAATTAVSAVNRPLTLERPGRAFGVIPAAIVVVFLAVALWRIGELVLGLFADVGAVVDPHRLPLSIAIVGVIALMWLGLARLRRSASVSADGIVAELDTVALPVAAALSIALAPLVIVLLVVQIITAWGGGGVILDALGVVADGLRSSSSIVVVRTLVGLVLLAIAVVTARRGRRALPELLATVGLFTLLSVMPLVVESAPGWSATAIAGVITTATLVLAVVVAARGLLDARRLGLLTVALLLSAAVAWRDVVADPLGFVIGASGIALALFGFVWGFVTDAEVTHSDSAAYPRASRVLLFIANAVFGITVLAFGALARDLGAAIDLDAFAQFGDELLGTALILAAVAAAWSSAMALGSADSRREPPTVAP